MGSIFNKLLTLGPSAFVAKAIIAAIVGDILFVAWILVRRAYRKRHFRKLDERVSWVRRNWESLLSGEIPFAAWRWNSFDRGIIEQLVLDRFETGDPKESARLLRFLRESGLIEKRIFEARHHHGWRRWRALVALGRTRAPEGVPALAEALRDRKLENRQAALRGLGQMGSPKAAEEILAWMVEAGPRMASLPVQNALINCTRECPQILLPYLRQADAPVREILARVMGEVATPSLEGDLIGLAGDALPELRAAAARAMSSAQPYHAVEVLTELSRDPVWFVRLRAVVALGKLRNALATPAILQALTDANRLIRMRAGEALVAQPGEMAPTFAQAAATRDRYGLYAYLAALENAGLRPKLEAELQQDRTMTGPERTELLQALANGKLSDLPSATDFADGIQPVARG